MKTWKLTARDVCRKPDMVIPDPPINRGALGMRVVLYPKMDMVLVGGVHWLMVGDDYKFKFVKNAGFISVYGFTPGVLFKSAPNELMNQGQLEYEATVTPVMSAEWVAGDMAAGEVEYHLPWYGSAAGKKIIWYNALPEALNTRAIIFEDTKGNVAYIRPFACLHYGQNRILDYLVPDITVEFIESTKDMCKLRLIRLHPAPASSEFSNVHMSWSESALNTGGGVTALYADPADPLNDNKRIVECVPGTYRFGVRSNYITTPRNYPGGCISVVVEVK